MEAAEVMALLRRNCHACRQTQANGNLEQTLQILKIWLSNNSLLKTISLCRISHDDVDG